MENPQDPALINTQGAINQNTNPGFFAKNKFTLIILIIIVVAAIPLLILSNKKPTPTMAPTPTQEAVASPSPTTIPLTTSNANDRLTQEDQQLQTTLNQVDSDMQSVNQIDTSQDSTAGL